jgi:hypothetical protein
VRFGRVSRELGKRDRSGFGAGPELAVELPSLTEALQLPYAEPDADDGEDNAEKTEDHVALFHMGNLLLR